MWVWFGSDTVFPTIFHIFTRLWKFLKVRYRFLYLISSSLSCNVVYQITCSLSMSDCCYVNMVFNRQNFITTFPQHQSSELVGTANHCFNRGRWHCKVPGPCKNDVYRAGELKALMVNERVSTPHLGIL